jgi:hypothetical protein
MPQINQLAETTVLAKGDQLPVMVPNATRNFERSPINELIQLLSGGVFTTLDAGSFVSVPGVPVADLPDPTLGRRALVTDSTATTFNNVVAGGGASTTPVFADGTAWRIG